jgi:hypothetical protein
MSGQHQPLQKSSARSRINRGKRLSRRWLSQQRTHQRRLMQEAALARAVGGAEPELTVLPGASIPSPKRALPQGGESYCRLKRRRQTRFIAGQLPASPCRNSAADLAFPRTNAWAPKDCGSGRRIDSCLCKRSRRLMRGPNRAKAGCTKSACGNHARNDASSSLGSPLAPVLRRLRGGVGAGAEGLVGQTMPHFTPPLAWACFTAENSGLPPGLP